MHGRFCYKNYLGKFTNLIKEPTCFKNPENPTLIDLIDLTNKPLSFKNTYMIEDRAILLSQNDSSCNENAFS